MNDAGDAHTPSVLIAHAVMHTDTLTLIPASAHHLRAELESNARLAALLDAEVPPSWPPGEYDRDAQEYFLQMLERGGESATGWFGWYAVTHASQTARARLVASGGYLGPPSEEGTVEIGYSVCPEHRGMGYAKSMARSLAQHALEWPGVTHVIAHTDADNPASAAVLTGSGFEQAKTSDQPGTLLFEFKIRNAREI